MCIATFVLAVTAAAQVAPTSQPQQDDKIIVGTNLVTVNVIVTDTGGRYVRDLSRDQLTIYDNKVKQEIAHFSADAASVSIGIVCEIHESASGRAVLAEMSRASGGTTYLPEMESESELAYICSQIASELRQQYTLAFYPNPTANDGWHKLKVRVRHSQAQSNLKLSYRKGYRFGRDQ
jgi:hypothetical protein